MNTPVTYVIVEIFDDARSDAQAVAEEIVRNMADVKTAQPASFDFFGRFVLEGREVKA